MLCLLSINCNDRHYGLGVYLLAAMVRRHRPEWPLRVLNLPVQTTPRQLLFELMAEPARVYGFSVHHGHGPLVLQLARDLRRLQPDAVIVVGGTDVVALDPDEMAADIDWCVVGEGEAPLLALLDAVARGQPPAAGQGLLRPRELHPGLPLRQAQREQLDELPSPYLDGVFDAHDRYPTVYVETYRGCVWNCSFCYEGRGRKRIASYSRGRIEAELGHLLADPRVRRIEFYDTIFNVERERTRWLLDFLIAHNRHGTRLIGEFMLEWLDDEEIARLDASGFEMIEVGLQSVKQRTLQRSGRKTDLARFDERARAVLSRTAVDLCIDAMYGLEDETLDDFLATVDHLGTLEGTNGRRPTPILFTTRVHPGTRLHRRRAIHMVLDGGQDGTPLASPSLSLAETEAFHALFHGYLVLRGTCPRTMNDISGVFARLGGVPLSRLHAGVARVLRRQPSTRLLFDQVDWTEFRANRLLRFYLSAIDRAYLHAVAEELGVADAPGLRAALQALIEREDRADA
ncbi:radical SAM protein [Piscinibacter sakaiensis]|uniref:Uncharacterized protein n=1 Tax=Piscinibacter sakaiensis TaxID=1547922 RepID=A0A0K8P0R8_PISS1|nr:radical SAM protein [Piscinibacter sakaiensis]GAP36223.1 hypothetical protein ISF6_2063 [Piscinibacter sakaiensis]